jgi:hypothetical protein
MCEDSANSVTRKAMVRATEEAASGRFRFLCICIAAFQSRFMRAIIDHINRDCSRDPSQSLQVDLTNTLARLPHRSRGERFVELSCFAGQQREQVAIGVGYICVALFDDDTASSS